MSPVIIPIITPSNIPADPAHVGPSFFLLGGMFGLFIWMVISEVFDDSWKCSMWPMIVAAISGGGFAVIGAWLLGAPI
jgi:hypothetical protein